MRALLIGPGAIGLTVGGAVLQRADAALAVAARTRFREVRFYVFAWCGAVIASAIMTARHWFGIDIPEDTQLDAMRVVMVFDAAFMGLAILGLIVGIIQLFTVFAGGSNCPAPPDQIT